MQFTYAAIAAAAFAGFSAANLTPSCVQGAGTTPEGNPIHAPLTGTIVPAGAPFTITWTPTSTDKVTILLLKGPSTNVIPIDTIATSIDNSGSFVWTPSTALSPTADATGYGIEIVDDSTCTYQYSTQFGVSNAAGTTDTTTTTVVTSTVTATDVPVTTITSAAPVTVTTTATVSTITSAAPVTATTTATVSTLTETTPTTTLIISTVAPPANGTSVYPTGTASGTISGTAGSIPTSTIAPFTGAAGRMIVGAGSIVGAVAALAAFAL